MYGSNLPSDLTKDMNDFTNPQVVPHFLNAIGTRFGVYSPQVQKLYTNFEYQHVDRTTMAAMPRFEDFDSIFHCVDDLSIEKTSISLVLGKTLGKTGIYLRGTCGFSGKIVHSPLQEGLIELFSGSFVDKAFIPVVKMTDIYESSKNRLPVLPLYRVAFDQLAALSDFERNDLVGTLKANIMKANVS